MGQSWCVDAAGEFESGFGIRVGDARLFYGYVCIPSESTSVLRRYLPRFVLKAYIPFLRRWSDWRALDLRVDKIEPYPSLAGPTRFSAILAVWDAFITL